MDLENDNHEAAMIYGMIKRQVITLFNGEHDEIIDLDYGTLIQIMRLYRVKDQQGCFGKVTKIFHHFLNERRQKQGD